MSVWMPDELAATVRAELPEVNLSAVLQDGLRALLGCRHERLACSACGHQVSVRELEDVALGRFYADLSWELGILAQRGGTAEGAARVAKSVGERYRITMARRLPLPRPTRAERQRAKVRPFLAADRAAEAADVG